MIKTLFDKSRPINSPQAPQVPFNARAIENHYGLDMASFLLQRQSVRSVRICTQEPEVAKAAVRRLSWMSNGLIVEHEQIASVITASLGIRTSLVGEMEPDAALVLFSRQQYAEPPLANYIVVLGHNALSYKSLLYKAKVGDNILSQSRWLRQRYTLSAHVGLFGPRFLINWTLSLAAGSWLSSYHFRLGQRAMDRIYETGIWWWMGYITVLAGQLQEEK